MPQKNVEPSIAYRLLYPGLTAIITSSWANLDDATPATSCSALSFRPALFGVSISPQNFIHQLIRKSKSFAINLLSAKDIRSASIAGDISRRFNTRKVMDSGFTLTKSKTLDSKVIRGALGVIECSLERRITIGDHDLFVGKFETAYAEGDFRGYWTFDEYVPILYSGSTRNGTKHRFAQISKHFVEIPYQQDMAKKEVIELALQILREKSGDRTLDRSTAVKLISEKLNLRVPDSKYLVDHLVHEKMFQFGHGSKTSY